MAQRESQYSYLRYDPPPGRPPLDHLPKSDTETIKVLFGEEENVDWNKEDIDWNAIDSQLISRRIVVTRNRVNGVKLGSLRLRNLYGINITRVNRAGIDLIADTNLRLQIGDRLTIVGEKMRLIM